VDAQQIHRYARERGFSGPLYATVRVLAAFLLRSWFRIHVSGADHVPTSGPAIIAANHKSFLDAFFVGLATTRPVRFMAKNELFKGPLGWLFSRLGAFPVRRGAADADAIGTARAVLDQGGLLIMFPEGTRVDEADALGSPHHGAGRLAGETGAVIVPTAISGTSHLWLGPIPKPRRIDVALLPPVAVAGPEAIDRIVWPAVQEEYGRLRATPGAITAALAALGIGGALAATRARAATRPRLLGLVQPRRLRRRSLRSKLLRRLRIRR
jgi:1-acyl-sn-glycerol-3-phosphate acyltransferase